MWFELCNESFASTANATTSSLFMFSFMRNVDLVLLCFIEEGQLPKPLKKPFNPFKYVLVYYSVYNHMHMMFLYNSKDTFL